MISSNVTHNQAVHMRILSDDQIFEIKQAAYEVMEKTWYRIIHPGAVKMLKAAGCRVKDDLVRVPRAHIVEEAPAHGPQGHYHLRPPGQSQPARGGGATVFTVPPPPVPTPAMPSPARSMQRASKTSPAAPGWPTLSNTSIGSCPWARPRTCRAWPRTCYEFQAVVTNTTKPVVFIGYYAPAAANWSSRWPPAVAGGMDELRDKPFVLLYPGADHAPRLPRGRGRTRAAGRRSGHAANPGTHPSSWAHTAPMTLAGAIVQGLVEGFMSLVHGPGAAVRDAPAS